MDTNVYSLDAQRRRVEAFNVLRDRLKADASRLRQEAFAEFVVGADGLIRNAAHRAVRAANRLAARLHQHDKQRAATVES